MFRTTCKTLAGLILAITVGAAGLITAPATAEAAPRPAPIHLHTSTNYLDFRDSHRGAFRFKVTAHHKSGKVSAGKARIYVNGRHLQTRTLHKGRAIFKIDRSRLPDNQKASVKVRVIPWNKNIGHHVVTRTIRDNQPKPRVSDGRKVVRIAKAQVGDRYQWGKAGPSRFDCSGLVRYSYKKATGKNLPHQSTAQMRSGRKVAHAKPGDIVWTPGHVSIYVGNGKVVEAARPGTKVRVVKMWQKSPTYIRP